MVGRKSVGLPSKRGFRGRQNDPVRGSVRLLSATGGGAYLRPIGQTPVLYEELSRDHLSAMSGITLEGKLLMMEQESSFKGEEVVRFLKHALRQITGKLLVIWDGSPIHRSIVVKEFLKSGAASSSRLQLEQLPGYAPELNPDEGIWKHLKYVELKNVCCRNLSELRRQVRKAKERLRHKKHVILGCIRQPGFEV